MKSIGNIQKGYCIFGIAMNLLLCFQSAQLLRAQQPFGDPIVPQYSPTVVGGVPANARTLQQPIHLADRRSSQPDYNDASFDIPQYQLSDFDPTKATPTNPVSRGDVFEAGKVVAVIGDEYILVGQLIPPDRIKPDMVGSAELEMRLRKSLHECVTRKALANHFFAEQVTGKSKKEREEIRNKMDAKVADIFVNKALPEQLEKMKCETREQLRNKLAESGTSERAMLREFSETVWAQRAVFENVPEKQTVDIFDLRDYYDSHKDEWQKPLRVKFRILSAMFSKYPNRDAAYADMVAMGNEVYFGGSFEGVAKKKSSGFNADQGGQFEWTTRGALRSKQIEDMIFSIEPKALSPIIEDSDGFHIVEVTAREEEYVQTFAQSQTEIRKKLIEQKQDKARKEFINKVRENTKIWTLWPEDIPGSEHLSKIM